MPGPHPQKKATGVEWGLPKCGCVCYRQQRQKDGVSQALWIPDGSITGLKCSGHGARVFVFSAGFQPQFSPLEMEMFTLCFYVLGPCNLLFDIKGPHS